MAYEQATNRRSSPCFLPQANAYPASPHRASYYSVILDGKAPRDDASVPSRDSRSFCYTHCNCSAGITRRSNASNTGLRMRGNGRRDTLHHGYMTTRTTVDGDACADGNGSPREARWNQIENIKAVYQNRHILVFSPEPNSLPVPGSALNLGRMHPTGEPCQQHCLGLFTRGPS